MRILTSENFQAPISAKTVAAIHFDAPWDKHSDTTRQSMIEAEAALGEQASFAEMDCDANAELARSIPVLNVPLVAYFREGRLVAALIGGRQNVRARMERLLSGESIGYEDGTDSPSSERMAAKLSP